MRTAFDQIPGATLTEPTGTLWDGSGRIYMKEQALGTLAWDFRPGKLFAGSLNYDFALAGPEHDLDGEIAVSSSATELKVSGDIAAPMVNDWLAPYDIAISGTVTLDGVELGVVDGSLKRAGGSVHWSGGMVRYTLSGRTSSTTLPPLVAFLEEGLAGPGATVFTRPGQTPLIKAELLENGYAKVGITKLLTKLLDNPWPGSDPDHAIVLEVEEQVL
ncbi:MAG: type II secretion system protein N [Gammaproteobacteria bacterium]|nr:type II secretion system protein N [Gammaproteobacteria bacterium]